LLKLHAWDLQQVLIKDYSAELQPLMTQEGLQIQLAFDSRSEMTLAYNDTDSKWNPIKLTAFDPKKGEHVEFKLGKDEELNEESLNGLKSALEDLKIVDVAHKPQGLSNDLKAGQDFMKNPTALKDLASKGFTPARKSENGPREIVSSDGEVIATMKNGTQYVLRFGNLTNAGGQDKEEKAAAKEAKADLKKGDKSDKNGVNRYLFVMAQFDQNAVKRPELQKLPDLPANADAKAEPKTGAAADAGKAKNAAAKAGDKAAEAKAAAKTADASAKKDDAAKKDDTTKKNDVKKGATAAAAKKEDPAAKKKDEAVTKKDAATGKDLEKTIADRKRIEAENQNKLNDYQELIKKGQENVKELNLRFGDWYFVVSDDVFHKIRLSRDKVVKKKEPPKPGAAGQPDAKGAAAPSAGVPGLPSIPGATPGGEK
jgi:hypothetical protein